MLRRAKRWFWRKHLVPFLGRRNWRPARQVPLGEVFLQGRFGFDEEEAIKRDARRMRQRTMASFERLATLWQQVRYLDRAGIGGALVECGVWRGGCAGMMALAHLESGPASREIHLFDSFEGLPEPVAEKDGLIAIRIAQGRATGQDVPIGACVAAREDCERLLYDEVGYPRDLVHVHAGWFSQTMPPAPGTLDTIALLRLDADWYEPTRLCLETLYDRVAVGGVVVIDDYGHFPGCRKAVDEFLAERGETVLLNHIDYTARSWVKTR